MNTAYELAKAEIGTVEWKDGNNPKVVAYFKDSGNPGVKDDETAWCAAFVGAMLRRAGMKSTGALNARSYLDWGTPVERKDAQPGDVVIFKRGNSSWQGHVAFFVKDRGALLDVLGGNQSDAVNIKGYSAKALLGIRRAPKATAKPHVKEPPVSVTRSAPHVNAAKKPAQRASDAKPSQRKKDRISFLQGVVTAASLALAAWVTNATQAVAQVWHDFWLWVFSFIN